MTLLQQALEPLRTASKALTEYGATGEIDDLLTAQAGLELVIEQFEQHIAQAEQPVAWLVCSVNKDKSLSLESAAEIAALKAQKDGAYLERNRCVALIAQMAIALGLKAGKARTAIEGWSDDWHGCIYIDLPAGQVSWHYHDSQAFLFDALPTYEGKWDGHDTAEKYRRVGLPFESALRTQLEEARKDAMNEGIGKAAAWVDARREAFMLANGHEDPSTGTWEYGSGPHAQAKLDYDSELAEIADGLRELKAPRFSRVSCSQCGQLFGPRDFGYSRCIDHAGRAAIDAAKEQGK